MAASALSLQTMSVTGLEATYASCNADGNYFTNNGHTFMHVINGSGGDITVTVDSPTECNQGSTHDVTVTVTAGEERMIGPFEQGRFNDDDGRVQVSYSTVTSLTAGAIKIR
jgi:hypothetical protein